MYCRISQNDLNPDSLPARLRALPGFAPPPGGWARLQQRRQRQRYRRAAAGTGLALAASLMVAVGLVGYRPDPVPAPADEPSLQQLISHSQRLELQLARARPQVVVWDGRNAARAEILRQQLMAIDAQLDYAPAETSEPLWRDRVQLMNALVELHRPEAPALQYASYQY
jgi:hypothetical protein